MLHGCRRFIDLWFTSTTTCTNTLGKLSQQQKKNAPVWKGENTAVNRLEDDGF